MLNLISRDECIIKKCSICGVENTSVWRIDKGTGKAICNKCYAKIQNNDPNSYKNTIKLMADWRTGNLDRFKETGKAVIGQWIVAKTIGVKDLNIENNNFKEPVDLSKHSKYGLTDVKIATFNNIRKEWHFSNIEQRCDTTFFLCMDNNKLWKIIPKIFMNATSLSIYEIPLRGLHWYEKFKTDAKYYNDIYQSVDIPRFFSPLNLWN